MKQTMYSAPRCEVRKSGLRASILAGSKVVKGHNYDGWNARQRVSDADENLDRGNTSGKSTDVVFGF